MKKSNGPTHFVNPALREGCSSAMRLFEMRGGKSKEENASEQWEEFFQVVLIPGAIFSLSRGTTI